MKPLRIVILVAVLLAIAGMVVRSIQSEGSVALEECENLVRSVAEDRGWQFAGYDVEHGRAPARYDWMNRIGVGRRSETSVFLSWTIEANGMVVWIRSRGSNVDYVQISHTCQDDIEAQFLKDTLQSMHPKIGCAIFPK
jgi:hypothetical protein